MLGIQGMENKIQARQSLEELNGNMPMLIHYVRRNIPELETCKDIAQETIVRYLGKLKEGMVLRNPRAWMFRIAHNLMIDELRRRRLSSISPEDQDWIPNNREEIGVDPPVWMVGEREIDRDELLGLLPRAFNRLPAELQRLFEAKYRGQMSCLEIANCCDSSERAIAQKLFRSRTVLRKLLVEEDANQQHRKQKQC